MNTDQIYGLVNSVVEQSLGDTGLTAVDTSTLVSLGDTVLSSSANTEAFLNTLAQRIGKTIIRYRMYRNKLADLVVDDFTFGAIVQKLRVNMPEAEADDSYNLVNGQSIDHYKISKPSVEQKIFVTRTPYKYRLTIQEAHLREAFLSAEAMGAFISSIFGELRNAIEKGLEELGRTCINTAVTVVAGTAQEIKLVTEYNATNPATPATVGVEALKDPDFLKWAGDRIDEVYDDFQDMSVLYNDTSIPTFTPAEDIRFKLHSIFARKYQSVMQADTFNKSLVDLPKYTKINYWQSHKAGEKFDIKQTRPDGQGGTEVVTVSNVIGVMHDREALGTYKKDEIAATTPLNADGLYYNTVYHEKQLYFYDPSENLVAFTLN